MSEPLARIATTEYPDALTTELHQFVQCWRTPDGSPPWLLLAAIVGTLNALVDAENARRAPPVQRAVDPSQTPAQ